MIVKTFNTVDIAKLIILWQVGTVLKHSEVCLKDLPIEQSSKLEV